MDAREPSRTALAAAAWRAAHQSLDGGVVFTDPFAYRMLGPHAEAIVAGMSAIPGQQAFRLFMAARSRVAEDRLAQAVARSVRQVVILGAGLDTFGLRNPHAEEGLRVFEVDHPATQVWKRARLAEAGLTVPAWLSFAAVDFEQGGLGQGLEAAGFSPDQSAFFLWLGVVPYLAWGAVAATLDVIAGVPGAEVVFDYSEPFENYPAESRANAMALGARAAAMGEPWLCLLDPAEIARDLTRRGFSDQEDLESSAMAARYGAASATPPADRQPGGHVIWARRPG